MITKEVKVLTVRNSIDYCTTATAAAPAPSRFLHLTITITVEYSTVYPHNTLQYSIVTSEGTDLLLQV